jgi:hypothetical protein
MAASNTASAFVDAATSINYTNPLASSDNLMRWLTNIPLDNYKSILCSNVTVSQTLNPSYQRQVCNAFAATGLSNTDYAALNQTFFGNRKILATVTSTNIYNLWVDYGGSVTYSILSAASGSTERWSLSSDFDTGALTSGGNYYTQQYFHQFKYQVSYSLANAGTPTAPL